jgi:hypothetical protein
MPRVPMLSTPQVELRPIATPRLRAEADTGTVALTAIAKTASNVAEFFAAEQQKADEIRLEDAEAELRTQMTEALSQPETGIMNLSGRRAMDAESKFYQDLDQRISRIQSGLANDRQRQLFARRAQQLRTDVQGRVSTHIANETERVDAAAYEANVAGDLDRISTQAKTGADVTDAVTTLANRATLYADRRGMPPEAIANMRKQVVSRARMTEMQALVDSGRADAAANVLAQYGDTLTAEDRAKATDWVQTAQKTSRAQSAEDRIMGAYGDRPAEARAAARQEPPEIRDDVVRRVNNRLAEIEQERRVEENNITDQAFTTLEQRGYNALQSNTTLWAQTATVRGLRSSLQARAEQQASGTEPETNWGLWAELATTAQNNPQELLKPEYAPIRMRPYLSNTEYKQYVTMHAKAQRGDNDAVRFTGQAMTSTNDLILQEGQAMNLFGSNLRVSDLKGRQLGLYNQLQTTVTRTIEDQESQLRRPLSASERRNIVFNALAERKLQDVNSPAMTPIQARGSAVGWASYIRSLGGVVTAEKVQALINADALYTDPVQKTRELQRIATGR